IGNVNTEIQFHTKPDMLFKTIDDIVYHTTYNSEIDSRTPEGVEMVQIKNYLEECAKAVFARGTFQKNVPDMDQFIEECVKKNFVRQQKPKLKNLGIYYREAYVAQQDLVNRTAKLIPAMESILEKEQTQEWGITPDEKYISEPQR
ncbi:MAG: hypothetical protein MJ054_00860, partial [Clostridia bacterium]|nr:hypothetical protein [Clostridia bacterium]